MQKRDQNGKLAAQRFQERYFRHVRDVLVVETLAGCDSTAICTRTFRLKQNPSRSWA